MSQRLNVIDVDSQLDEYGDLGLDSVIDNRKTYSSFDQAAVDEFLRGFSLLKSQIDDLDARLSSLENINVAPADGIEISDIAEAADDGALVGDERFNQIVRFENTVFFENEVIFSNNQAGIQQVIQGNLFAEVKFSKELSAIPIITVTPADFVNGSYRYSEVTKEGFKIELSTAQPNNIEFSWRATLVN